MQRIETQTLQADIEGIGFLSPRESRRGMVTKKLKSILSPRGRKRSKYPREPTSPEREPILIGPPMLDPPRPDVQRKEQKVQIQFESNFEEKPNTPVTSKVPKKPLAMDLSLPMEFLNQPKEAETDESIICRLCDQPFPVAEFEGHEMKCIKYTIDLQGFQKQ